jgi:hypothetical protein
MVGDPGEPAGQTTTPPFLAEKQRESMMAMVNKARAVEARKRPQSTGRHDAP